MSAIQQLLTDYIDIWTAADTEKKSGRGRSSGNGNTVFGVKKLRELILELAVRGKLVPQDPSNEPASELLKKIQTEKSKLIAEGKLKKEKISLQASGEEIPFKLPLNWTWTTLSVVCQINPRNDANDGLQASFVPMTLIGTGFNSKHDQEIRVWKAIKQGFTHFAEGDIGVAKITPCFENSKACVFSGLANGIGAGTTELHIVRPLNGMLDARYILAYLKSPQFLLVGETKMTGTAGQKRLPKDFVESNPFPLPPLSEQHRIVTKIDELMVLCDQLETQHISAAEAHEKLVSQLLATLNQSQNAEEFIENWRRIAAHFDTLFTTESSIDSLKQTLLQLAAAGNMDSHGDKAFNMELSDLLYEDSLNGCSKKPSDEVCGVPILRISAGTGSNDFYVDESDHKWVELSDAEINKFLLAPDDLLACRFNGNLHYVGSFSLYRGIRGVRQVFPDKLIRFRVNQDLVLPNYLRYVLNAVQARIQIESFCATTVGNIGISATNLKTIKVRVPSIDEQRCIVAKVDELMGLCDQLQSHLIAANQLQQQLADVFVEQALVAGAPGKRVSLPNRDDARALLGAEIIHQLHNEKTFGQVKLQKLVHLCEHIAGVDAAAGEYQRFAAGPHDPELIADIESTLQSKEWYEEYSRDKFGHAYRPLKHAGAHRKEFGEYWQDKLPIIQKLIDLTRKWDTERCEIFSTLYAAWNDLLILGKPISDEAILSEVLERWHKRKTNISKKTWLENLEWLRNSDFIPTGTGRPTRSEGLFE